MNMDIQKARCHIISLRIYKFGLRRNIVFLCKALYPFTFAEQYAFCTENEITRFIRYDKSAVLNC